LFEPKLTISSRVLKNYNLVLWYLLHGASPNIKCGRDGKTPMTIAIKESSLSTIKLLGSFGGQISSSDLFTEVDYLSSNDEDDEPWNIVARSEIIEHVLERDWRH
jgi:ankyrin repeat protein